MKLKEVKNIFEQELSPVYPKEEINSFFYQLIEHFLGVDRFILVLEPQYVISKDQETLFFDALARLRKEQPLQHIIGKVYFMNLELSVDHTVLIPRPETEELVHWILSDTEHKQSRPLEILDIGTGSGCIAIALAKNRPESRLSALDISGSALKVASNNAQQNKVQIHFLHKDIMALAPLQGQWDIIVSNPPYVREQEKRSMRDNVKNYEPGEALFVPDETPLLYFERISDLALNHLRPGGALYFEINQYLAADTRMLLEERNFSEIELRKDMYGNERFLKGILSN